MLNLLNFRKNIKGLPDLIPYAMLADNGVLVNKDCSFTAAWEFRGSDTASSTMEELDFVTAQVNHAFMLLGSGWMMHVDAVRRPATSYPDAELSHFPDRVSNMIDEERRAFFARESCFETSTVLTLTYKPSASYTAGLLGEKQTFEKMLEEFNNHLDNFESIMSGVLEMNRLDEYDQNDAYGSHQYSTLLSHVQQCLTGDFQPMIIPSPCAMYLDGILGARDLVGGMAPKLDDKYLAILSIDAFPQESYPAMLEMLSGLPLSYRFNTRYIMLDQLDAIKEIENYRKGWAQQMFNLKDKYFNNPNAKVNRDAAAMNEDAEQAKAEAQGGLLSFGYLSSTVVLMHEDQDFLARQAQYVQREISLVHGFGARLETYNAVEAWLGSLPGVWYANVRRPLMSTINLAHMLPLASIWPGAATCPCPFYPKGSRPLMICTTDGSTPFRFNLHVGDLGHTMIMGPTGAGKSTLLALICAQFLGYEDARVFAFDKGMSLFPLCMGVGGSHYDVGGDDSRLAFAPLSRIDESDSELAWAIDWIEKLFEIQGVNLQPNDTKIISEAMNRLVNQPKEMRSLTVFKALLQDQRLKDAMSRYCETGPMARFLDAKTDTLGFSNFMVFEIEELMNMGEKSLIPVLLYLFHRIQQTLDGKPTILVLDEAWVMLGNDVFREQIREWLKVLRKANCAVILATQSLSDAARSEILDVLAESCPTKIFLSNFEAGTDIQRDQYRALGLNYKQIDIIAKSPKYHYYVVARDAGRRLMQLALGPKALAFVGSSGKEDIAKIKELMNRYDDGWIDRWLEYKQAA